MLRRANSVVTRARERIRAAAEHDPHAWPERDDDRAILVRDEDDVRVDLDDTAPPDGATRPPLGSPESGAPDLDGPINPGGVSGPPHGGRPHRPGERSTGLLRNRTARSPESGVPMGLRTAAAWSWRLIVVLVGLYLLVNAAATIAVVVVPVIVALLLAALLQPGAAGLVKRGWPRSLAALAMLIVGLAVVAGIITLVVERFTAGFSDLAQQVSEGIGQVQGFIVRTFPITQGQLEDAVARLQESLVSNQETLPTGAITTAATVGEVFTGIALSLF